MRITLPHTVNLYFSASPPEWRLRAIQKLQNKAFWDDPSVHGARTMHVYVDNLQTYKHLRAADIDVMYALVDRLTRENGLRAEYDALLAEAIAGCSAGGAEGDELDESVEFVAPDDCIQSMPKITGHTIIALHDRGVQNIQFSTVLKIINCVEKYTRKYFCFIIKI